MADPPTTPPFPFDDALCEQCGYPLKGLAFEAECPECGYAVAESSPARRSISFAQSRAIMFAYWPYAGSILLRPRTTYRAMSIDRDTHAATDFLIYSAMFAASGFTALLWLSGLWQSTVRWPGYSLAVLVLAWFFSFVAINLLTFIEMIGVTAFSKRRGWRIPFALARRVCCFAAVAWVPSALIVAVGFGLLQVHAADQLWFDRPLGLVRVRWICYAGLFVLSFLWFETLVWIGVRQVRFANAWPACAPKPDPADDTT